MSSLNRFDVAIARFEFEDKPGVTKPRPVVVIDIDRDQNVATIVVAKVTSHAPRREFPGEVILKDWKEAGLLKPSTVRCSKLAFLPASSLKAIIGSLTLRDAESVMRGLNEARDWLADYGTSS